MINFEYLKSDALKFVLSTKAKSTSAQFIAGGTNLVDLMKREVAAPDKIIDLNYLPFKDITEEANGITIGALALNSEVADSAIIIKKFPLLSLAINAGASAQIRNMATVGGNIMQRTRCPYFFDTTLPCNKRTPNSGCGALQGYNRMHAVFGASNSCIAVHPSDMCVALAALDASVNITSTKGNRKVAFADFHRLPGSTPQLDNNLQKDEIITSIFIPNNNFNAINYLKIRDRASYAFALVSVAVALQKNGEIIKTAKLAMGGVAAKPWRLLKVEQFLAGKKANENTFKAAAEIAMQGAQGFGQNNFKIKMGKAAVLETLLKANNL